RLYRSIFASLGRACPVHVYALNPCREFWEDVEPARGRPRSRRGVPRSDARQLTLALDGPTIASGSDGLRPADPIAGGPEDPPMVPDLTVDNPLLVRWGKPGRDTVRLLNQLADFDFDARFVDPTAARPSLLATLQ